jgi:hypothetical protein
MFSMIIALLCAAPLCAQTPAGNPEAFERVLVPLLTQPIHGAFGSDFRTELTVWNGNAEQPLEVWGLRTRCIVTCPTLDPIELQPGGWLMPSELDNNGTPGRFLYVPKGQSARLAANLRAFDVSRSATNFGTEIPLARANEFSTRVVLPGVPFTDRFRNTLRVYAAQAVTVRVSFEGPPSHLSPVVDPPPPQTLALTAGADVFEPAYAILGTFEGYELPVAVVVEPLDGITPLWAFMSVTSNDTQHITTISPEPEGDR